MTGPARIKVHVDRMTVRGGTRAEAHAMAEALGTSLSAHLADNPNKLGGAERLVVKNSGGPADVRGRQIGQQIGGALTGQNRGGK